MLQSSKQNQTPSVQHHQSTNRQKLTDAVRQRRNNPLSWLPLLLVILLSLTQCPPSSGFVVPNEVPSILSLVYSNIPPIKKGTDSRLGFGFKLGEQADFQILVELGPQKETRPIGNQDKSDGSSFNKRQINKSQQRAVLREIAKTEKSPPSTWLEKWSNHANPAPKKKVAPKLKPSKKPALDKSDASQIMPPLAPPQMPNQAMQQLQMLYKMATSTTTEESIRHVASTTTTPAPIPLTDTAASHLQQRLKVLKAPANNDDLQILMQKTQDERKTEVTKELMDVSLDK